MALYYSTRAINLNAGYKPTVTDAGSQISFTNPSTITTTQSDFITQGFRPGRIIEIVDGGATTQTLKYITVDTVTATTITTVETSIVTEAAAVDTPTLTQHDSGSWVSMFQYGVMAIYSGTMPTDINGLEGGTLIALITESAGAFTAGNSTNGLEFEFDAAGKIQIKTGQDWREDAGLFEADAAFGIIYDNGYITGDDSTNLQSPRIMGNVGLSGSDADIIVTTLDVNTSTPFAITQCDLTLPGQACS